MHPVEVTARFNPNGDITPVRFKWRDQDFPVLSTGRQWRDDRGLHILVMVPGDDVFELLYAAEDSRWYLSKPGKPASSI